MSYIWTAVFVCLLIATGYCSYIGDDDVIYQFMYRTPTDDESVRRSRWSILKMATSICGGLVLAAPVQQLLRRCCSITSPGEPDVLIPFVCMVMVFFSIAILQNAIRILRGRPTRPLFDWLIWRRSTGRLERKP